MKSDLVIGSRFGRLIVSSEIGGDPRRYLCTCDCGNQKSVVCYQLTRGKTTSCGCFRTELHQTIHRTHGLRHTREYKAWSEAKQRCHNPKSEKFKWYGARGISVWPAWRDDFQAFYDHIGPCPEEHELDRIHNDKGYEPGNVRWVTHLKNTMNRRNTVLVLYQGKQMTLTDYCSMSGVKYGTVWARIKHYPHMLDFEVLKYEEYAALEADEQKVG